MTTPVPRHPTQQVTIRHHVRDEGCRRALVRAPWAGSAGVQVHSAPVLSGDDPPGASLVLIDHAVSQEQSERLVDAVLRLAQRTPVVLLAPTVATLPALAEAAGVQVGPWTPPHEIRLRPEPGVDPRRGEHLLVTDRILVAEKTAPTVLTLVTANVGYHDYPVATWRPSTGLGTLLTGVDERTWTQREPLRLVAALTREMQGIVDGPDVRVGMIGYGAIGHEHALAVQAVPGLVLDAVSDPNPARVDAARSVAEHVRGYSDSVDLLADDDIDLVVVSTPPHTHADWATRALQAGKHVVLEKPMALTTAHCDALLDLAADRDRLVVVYQNRRFDPDYLVLRRLVTSGALGELFHLECFVGGFAHPCNYWHSDATVSGGAIFDWGSHVLDQVLDLMPGPIHAVSAANHKRRWHDVTNADHSRVSLHYSDGREAHFIHSDLAAAAKPKWWALGTEGAVVGDWRTERVIARTAVGTLDEDVLAPADSPARMSLHASDGSVTALVLANPPAQAFHRELADRLLRGLPMTVRAEQSREVVAVMEAAEQSAAQQSTPVPLR